MSDLRLAIDRLREDADTAPAEVFRLQAEVDRLKREARELAQAFEASFLEWLKARPGGEFTDGLVRYYVDVDKRTRCTDKQAAVEAILVNSGGDVAAIAALLSSDPFKAASVRNLIGAKAFDGAFTVEFKEEIRGGKPRRKEIVKSVRQDHIGGGGTPAEQEFPE